MNKYKFKTSERFAVYVTHLEKCYLCTKPVDFQSMQVDHVIPESLLDDQNFLNTIKDSFGLPSSFNINSYYNWMPSCAPCNRKKLAMVFEPTPIIQAVLQQAALKVNKAMELEYKTITNKKIGHSLSTLLMANEAGELSDDIKLALKPLIDFQIMVREPELRTTEINVTPRYRISRPSPQIRAKLIEMYDGSCQICNMKNKSIMQMCSIRSLSSGGQASLSNMLLLCPNHHQMLDAGKIRINTDLSIDGFLEKLVVSQEHCLSIESLDWQKSHTGFV